MVLRSIVGFETAWKESALEELFPHLATVNFPTELRDPAPGYKGGKALAIGGKDQCEFYGSSPYEFGSGEGAAIYTSCWVNLKVKSTGVFANSGEIRIGFQGNPLPQLAGQLLIRPENFFAGAGVNPIKLYWQGNSVWDMDIDGSLDPDTWNHIEIKVSSPDHNGTIEVRVNGFVVFQRTNAGTEYFAGESRIYRAVLGAYSHVIELSGDEEADNHHAWIDHYMVWNSEGGTSAVKDWLGPKVVESLYPISSVQADHTAIGNSPPPGDTNHGVLDDGRTGELDITDYVATDSTKTDLDLYKLSSPTFVGGDLTSVAIEASVESDDVGALPFSTVVANKYLDATSIVDQTSGTLSDETVIHEMGVDPFAPLERLNSFKVTEMSFGHGDETGLLGDATPNVYLILLDDILLENLAMFDSINPHAIKQDYTADGAADDPTNAVSQIYIQAPNLQWLADNGVTFLNTYAQPVCSPTRSSILTGSRPFDGHGCGTVVKEDVHDYPTYMQVGDYPGTTPTPLPHLLKPSGIQSAMVGKWHLSQAMNSELNASEAAYFNWRPFISGIDGAGWRHIPEWAGFDFYRAVFKNLNTFYTIDSPSNGDYYHYIINRDGIQTEYSDPLNEEMTNPTIAAQYTTKVQMDDAIALKSSLTTPHFMYMPFNTVHGPFSKPPEDDVLTPEFKLTSWPGTGFENTQGMMESFDLHLGRFLDSMTTAEKNNSVIIFSGDNGGDGAILGAIESERTMSEMVQYLVSLGSTRYKGSVYGRGCQTPMIVYAPRFVDTPGRETDALVHISDIYATVADFMNVLVPVHPQQDSISFRNVLENSSVNIDNHVRQEVFCETYSPLGRPLLNSLWNSYPAWSDASVTYNVNDLVRDGDKRWICILTNVSNGSREPSYSSIYWEYQGSLKKLRGYLSKVSAGDYTALGLSEGDYGYYRIIRNTPGVDEMYRTFDDTTALDGDWCEVEPLAIGVGDVNRDTYVVCATRLAELLTGSNPSTGGLDITLADGSLVTIAPNLSGNIEYTDSAGIVQEIEPVGGDIEIDTDSGTITIPLT
jgi:arylsulfatase A-like enzyme